MRVHFSSGHAANAPSPCHELDLVMPQTVSLTSQLTCLQTLAYEELQRDLGLRNVRELEDFLITDCFYTGIVRGKLDQRQRCLHVLEVVGRDVPREEFGRTMQGLAAW